MPDENIFPKAWIEFTLSNDGKVRGGFDSIAGRASSKELLEFYHTVRKVIWEEMKNVYRNERQHRKFQLFWKRRAE